LGNVVESQLGWENDGYVACGARPRRLDGHFDIVPENRHESHELADRTREEKHSQGASPNVLVLVAKNGLNGVA
jgi:hypothetical protein